MYKCFVKDRGVAAPKAIVKWVESNVNISFDWRTVFKLPYRVTNYTKIQYFQFRLLHRIIGVNSFLFRLHLINSPLCSFCNLENETIEHLFWDCPIVSNFWHASKSLSLKTPFVFDKTCVLFGYTENVLHPINTY